MASDQPARWEGSLIRARQEEEEEEEEEENDLNLVFTHDYLPRVPPLEYEHCPGEHKQKKIAVTLRFSKKKTIVNTGNRVISCLC